MLNARLTRHYDKFNLIVDEQNGFRKKRSCEEHLFTLTNIIRNRLFNKQDTFVAFIDLEKAFDWVDRTLLLFSLLRQNVDGNMYLMIKAMYTHTRSCIKLNKLLTDWFDVNSGVKQGDNMSPTLFSGLVNDLAHFIKQLGRGVQVGDDNISILLYSRAVKGHQTPQLFKLS